MMCFPESLRTEEEERETLKIQDLTKTRNTFFKICISMLFGFILTFSLDTLKMNYIMYLKRFSVCIILMFTLGGLKG